MTVYFKQKMNKINNDRLSRLDVFNKHQLKIAKDTMKLSCIGCSCLGGPNHKEAASIIFKLTSQVVGIDTDCTC